jgi:UDP-N-acetylglucosamine transferase subunit ALG13
MIFITVGTQLPFDRLIKSIDEWAAEHPELEICAQIGQSDYVPKNIIYFDYLTFSETENKFKQASLIISHAGMGSILKSLEYKKPIVIMPRQADKGEHRNNHQLATAKWMKDISGIYVAKDEKELIQIISDMQNISAGDNIKSHANEHLIGNLRTFLLNRRKEFNL